MSRLPALQLRSLKDQVYDYLRGQMQRGRLTPGSTLDLEETCRRLGVSKTPLREALLQLEMEEFVTIRPRRSVVVNRLSRGEIQELYEVIGALESRALAASFSRLKAAEVRAMRRLIGQMDRALKANDFDAYYDRNLRFHDVYLLLCGNDKLVRIVRTLKQRLYDFPRPARFIKEWELASIAEHRALLRLIRQGKKRGAVRFIQDVHWSFSVQEKYIRQYYPQAGWSPEGGKAAVRPGGLS